MNKVFYIACACIAVLGILYLDSCEGRKCQVETEVVYLPGKIDTVYFPAKEKTTGKLKADKIGTIVVSKDSFPEIDSLVKHTVLEGEEKDVQVNVYQRHYSDSALDATIIARTSGLLLDIEVKYKKKFPMLITRTDTIRSIKSVSKKSIKIFVGSTVGGNAVKFTAQPSVMIKTKKDLLLLAGYEITDKTYNVGVFFPLKNPFN